MEYRLDHAGGCPGWPPPSRLGGEIVFRIVPDQSEARFLIEEILAGSAKTVVGVTSAVSGEISGAFGSPQAVAVGPIQVDLSTLATDNAFRNRAIRDAILQTGIDANRFAVFQPTGIEGLPADVALGTAYELSLSGDLTIHGVTRPVTFAAVVTPVSETRLEGTASVSLPYSDFDIHILRLPREVASRGKRGHSRDRFRRRSGLTGRWSGGQNPAVPSQLV